MARPQKEGLEYFPLDIGIEGDDKLVVVVSKFGTLGFGIVVRLMSEVYKNGYFYPWTEREHHTFSSKINVDVNTVISVVSECIKWGFFHQKLYEKHEILTSSGFQKRFLTATSRRAKNSILPEYLLVPVKEKEEKTAVSDSNNSINDDNMSSESTQSKVKESKEEINDISNNGDDSEQVNSCPESSNLANQSRESPNLQSKTNVFGIYEREIGDLSQIVSQKLISLEEDFTEIWLKKAIEVAVFAGEKKLRFIEGVLRKWEKLKVDEPWNVEHEPAPSNLQRGSGRQTSSRHQGSPRPKIQGVLSSTVQPSRLTPEELEKARSLAKKLDERLNKKVVVG